MNEDDFDQDVVYEVKMKDPDLEKKFREMVIQTVVKRKDLSSKINTLQKEYKEKCKELEALYNSKIEKELKPLAIKIAEESGLNILICDKVEISHWNEFIYTPFSIYRPKTCTQWEDISVSLRDELREYSYGHIEPGTWYSSVHCG